MQYLLCQTRRLKEENEELRAQMSSLGPSQSRQPQSQRTASRRTDEASFPGNAEFPSSSHTTQYEEEFLLARQVQLDEGTDSTRVSTKMRHDRKSRLSDAMRARLEPQVLDIEGKPNMTKTLEARLSSSATTIMSKWPS